MAKTTSDYSKDYAAAKKAGNAAGMQAANNAANAIRKANGQAAQLANGDISSVEANAARKASSSSGGGDWIGGTNNGSSSRNASGISNIFSDAYNAYTAQQEAEKQAKADAISAAVDQYVSQANDSKSKVRQAGADANSAAQEAYMQAANPYGAAAEGLAARGLAFSGAAESSKISTGNTYQKALNQNARQVNDQLSSIDASIRDARMNGDIKTADALAQYYENVANAGLTNAQNIASATQWQKQFDSQEQQNAFNNAMTQKNYELNKNNTDAQYTGKYNGKDIYQVQQDNRNVLLQKAQTLAAYGDFSGYKALGYTNSEITNMRAAYLRQQQLAAAKKKKSGGSSGGGRENTEHYVREKKTLNNNSESSATINSAPGPLNKKYIMPDGTAASRAESMVIQKYGFNPYTLVGAENKDKATILAAYLEMQRAL